jgi:hypothetical protein
MLTEEQKKMIMNMKGFKAFKSKYEKELKKMKGGKQKGGDFWSDMWNGIKKTAGDVNTFLKKTKALSTAGEIATFVMPLIPGAAVFEPEVIAATTAAKTLGYGKKKKMVMVKGMGKDVVYTGPLEGSNVSITPQADVFEPKMTNKMTVGPNGQFQPVIVGSGTNKSNQDLSFGISPTVYGVVSSTKRMEISK